MIRRLDLACFTVALLAVCLPGRHADAQPARHTRASLLASDDAVRPGQPTLLAIRLEMDPQWHTYWRNPGDSGLATRVHWTLPPGFEAGEIQWPWPKRFDSGPVTSYGYEGVVLLPVQIRAPSTITDPQVRIAARVDWVECHELCLPGRAELSTVLPVRKTARPGPQAPAIAAAQRRLPVAATGWRFRAELPASDQKAVLLTIVPPRGRSLDGARFFPFAPRVLDHAARQPAEPAKQGLRLRLSRDPNGDSPARLSGVLVVETGGAEQGLLVDVPVTANARAGR